MYVGKRLERPNLRSLDNPLHLPSHNRPTNDDIDVSVLPPNQMTIIMLGPTSGYSLVGVVRQLTVLPLCLKLILLPGYLASMVALQPGTLGFEACPGPLYFATIFPVCSDLDSWNLTRPTTGSIFRTVCCCVGFQWLKPEKWEGWGLECGPYCCSTKGFHILHFHH